MCMLNWNGLQTSYISLCSYEFRFTKKEKEEELFENNSIQ